MLAFLAALSLALGVALLAAQLALPSLIDRRLQQALAERDDVRGRVDGVRVCLPCGSYTLLGPRISLRAEGEWRPSFAARALTAALLPRSLLAFAPAGVVRLDEPVFHFRAGEREKGTRWREVGDALVPIPLGRVTVRGGRVELANTDLDPVFRLTLADVELSITNLQRRLAVPVEVEAEARVGEEGRIEARVSLPPGRRPLALQTTLRGIPIRLLNDYLRSAVGVDVAAGTLDGDGDFAVDEKGRLEGALACRAHEVELLEVGDVVGGNPIGLLWEVLAASGVAVGSSIEGSFDFELEVQQTVADPGVDAWSLFGALVRDSLWGLLESPARVLLWLAERATLQQA